MSVKTLSITLLLLSVHLCSHASAAYRTPPISRPCCTKVTTINVIHKVRLESYRKQAEDLPCVNAIIFNTDDGEICADPEAHWVKKIITKMSKE